MLDATADFFAATKRIVFVSIFYFFITLLLIPFWIGGAACVTGLNKITASPDGLQGKDIDWTGATVGMLCFMVFGFIWLIIFIQDKTSYICMVAATNFYFTSSADQEGQGNVL